MRPAVKTTPWALPHILSFDVEEHFQVSAFWSEARRQQWDRLESRVESNTRQIAHLLAQHGRRATFFVLGWVAERHPDLVRALAKEGHEVASHGYGHELVSSQTPRSFRDDVQRSKEILEDLTGKPVVGYRAPSFSITDSTPWALPILAEAGYLYDSSIYKRFQCSAKFVRSVRAVPIETEAGVIWEVPPSTMSVCGFHVPVAGGGYFRLFPYAVSRLCLRRLERQGAQLVFYLHPWEIDSGQPRMEGPMLSKFRHYLNLKRTKHRLTRLVGEFVFAPVVEAVRPIADAIRLGRIHQEALATQVS